jgi:hypothetical protein
MWQRFLAWVLVQLQARIGEPDLVIESRDRVYLHRWWLIPKNRYCNIFLHHFLHDDDDRALHDHPFASLSICLKGAYWEDTPNGGAFYQAGAIKYRSATYQHRIRVGHLLNKTAWTLFITGPETREWGFWCPKGFVTHQQFEKQDGC